MIIYKIENLINKKIYIGQCIFSFQRRYRGKWWETTHNNLLKEDALKYGRENFSVEILEQNVQSKEILNKLEIFHIEKHKSLCPFGYNLTSGGDSKSPTIESRRKRGKIYTLKNFITNELFSFRNLNLFCEEKKLNSRILIAVLKKRRLSYGDFCLPKTELRFWILENKNLSIKEKVFENRGRIFCRKFSLKERAFESLVLGKEIDGWRVISFSSRKNYSGSRNIPKFWDKNSLKYNELYFTSS